MTVTIGRRELLAALGGAAAGWPLVARAQQPGKPPTIGFLGTDASVWRPWTAAFVGRLRELGWIEAIEYRWLEGRLDRVAGVCPPEGRLHRHEWRRRPYNKKGDIGHSHRLCNCERPCRRRLGRKSGATGGQRYWPVGPGDRSCRQATRTLARGCPPSPSIGNHVERWLSLGRAGDGRGPGRGSRARH